MTSPTRTAAVGLAVAGLWAIVPDVHAETVTAYSHRRTDYRLVQQPYDQIPGTLVTPHIKWADPLAGRRLRVLVIAPCWTTREAVELGQRLSIELTMIMTRSHEEFGLKAKKQYHEVRPAVLARLAELRLSRSRRYDVVAIGKMAWNTIPERFQRAILGKVVTGAGLVYVSPSGLDATLKKSTKAGVVKTSAEAVLAGVPVGMLPLEQKDMGREGGGTLGPMALRLGQHGQGRVACLDYRDMGVFTNRSDWAWRRLVGPQTVGLTPFVEDDPLFYDYYYAILAKVMLWCARRAPDVSIAVDGQGVEVPRDKLPGTPVGFSVTRHNKSLGACRVVFELRDRENRVLLRKAQPLGDGNPARHAVELPVLTRGLHVLDMWVQQDGRTLNWASAAFRVTGGPIIKTIATDKDAFPPGQPIVGTVTLAGAMPAGATLQVEARDTYGRLVARVRPTVGGVRARFAVRIAHPLSRVVRLDAQVVDARGVVEQQHTYVGVPNRTVDDFVAEMWASGLPNRTHRTVMYQCKRHGINGYYDGAAHYGPERATRASAFNLAWGNVMAHPYCQHIGGVGKWRQTAAGDLASYGPPMHYKVRAYRRYGAYLYSIGEENNISRDQADWARPKAMKAYRQFLQARYGSVQRLNKVWGSTYASWDAVKLIDVGEAKQQRRFPQYVDQDKFRVDQFVRVHEGLDAIIKREAPGAKSAVDICFGMDFDWPRMMKFLGGGWAVEPFRAFVVPGAITGNGIGCNPGQLSEFRMRYYHWQAMLDGGQMLFWWPVGFYRGLGSAAAFTPDASEPLECFSQAAEENLEIHKGIGKLLINSSKVRDPILIHYSNESYYAGMLRRGETTWRESRTFFMDAVEGVGLTHRAVSPEQVASLEFGPDARVLILPYSQAMSAKEVGAVERFVRAGGMLIADYRPALFDEYCRPCGPVKVVKPGTEKTCPKCGGRKRYETKTETVTRWVTCPLCGGAGKVLEGREVAYTGSRLKHVFGAFTPLHVNRVGKGAALYLGKSFKRAGDWQGLAHMLDQYAGVKRHFRVLDKLGAPRTDVMVASFANGRTTLYGVLPQRVVKDPPGAQTWVELPAEAHVYDVRRQDYLGHTKRFRTGAVPAVAKVFAALPSKPEAVTIRTDRSACAPGEPVTVRARVLPPGVAGCGLCVRFEVVGPDGQPMAHYLRKVVSTTGTFEYVIPVCLDEQPGPYQVTVEEVVTGLKAKTSFRVRPTAD